MTFTKQRQLKYVVSNKISLIYNDHTFFIHLERIRFLARNRVQNITIIKISDREIKLQYVYNMYIRCA